MKSMLTFTALAIGLIVPTVSSAQAPKLDGEWESGGKVLSIKTGGFVLSVTPILGDPGWKAGQIQLGTTDDKGVTPFKAILTTDAGFNKEVTGKVTKSNNKLTLQFDAKSQLKDLTWTPGIKGIGATTVRVFCEAGYVARFKVDYDAPNGFGGYKHVQWVSKNLTAGRRDNHKVPLGSRNVKVSGYMISAGERLIKTMNVDFNKEYKVYGTIIKNNMVAQ